MYIKCFLTGMTATEDQSFNAINNAIFPGMFILNAVFRNHNNDGEYVWLYWGHSSAHGSPGMSEITDLSKV